jgi:hypothetical protein
LQLSQQHLGAVPPEVALDGNCCCSAALIHRLLRRLQQACHI